MLGRQVETSVGACVKFILDQVAPSRLERSTAEGRGRDAGPSGIRRVPGEWLNASHTPPQSHTMHWIPITQLCHGLSKRDGRNQSRVASNFKLSLATSTLLFYIFVISGVETLEIKDLSVPTVVQSGSPGPLILDCNYEYEEEEKNGIVVKWFRETGPIDNITSQQVYQWITTLKPQVLGPLKGRLDIHYEASSDPHKKYRALSILHPTVNLTGDYKCHVSSNYHDAVKSQKMVVYSPAKDKNLKVEAISNQVNVTCVGYGLFPEPNIDITVMKEESVLIPNTIPVVIDNNTRVIPRQEGLYDIVAYKLFDYSTVSQDTTFVCTLSVPETKYAIHIESVFSPTAKQDTDLKSQANSAKRKLSDKNRESSLTGKRPHVDSDNGIWQLHQQERTLLLVSTVMLICLWTLLV